MSLFDIFRNKTDLKFKLTNLEMDLKRIKDQKENLEKTLNRRLDFLQENLSTLLDKQKLKPKHRFICETCNGFGVSYPYYIKCSDCDNKRSVWI